MRLEAGRRVLWRGPGELQFGSDPRTAVRLTGLSAAEESVLSRLGDGATTTELRTRARAAGADGARIEQLVADLDASGALVTRSMPPDPRATAVVAVMGLGRTGLALVRDLAAARIGTVILRDDGPVDRADVGRGGYHPRDIGQARTSAAARACHDTELRVRTTAPEGTQPDIVVLVEQDVADPVGARTLMAADLVHLSVVVREKDVVVGPMVRPGASACLRCLDLHRCQLDDRWPMVATQLAVRPRSGPRAEDPLLAALAGATAAAQVVGFIEGAPVLTVGATLELRLPEGAARRREWPVHPQCGCTGLPEPRA
jgi:bacteriocin biosynthesis cyclodehydratase domain-containing protein